MAVHWVNYDLNKTGQDYTKLIEYLKSHQGWAKPLKSSILVKTAATAVQLRDEAKKHIDGNDDILVITVTGAAWASYGLASNVTEWLKRNL
ncbi:hypothetical protein N3356_010200, partial [Micrococcus luteus]|nr:hypothetical protein [Micrococcus luteus]